MIILEKILIVDDNPINIKVLGEYLKKKYSLYVANNGEKALNIARNSKPDLILLDIMMPVIDGYTVCKRLKNMAETKEIPVIFITAKNALEDIIKGFEMGGVDYIQKPFNVEELGARVKTHLELKRVKEEVEKKNSELELKNRELKEYISELNKTKERLMVSEKMASIGRFAGGIAHEINSPLAGLITSVALMEQDVHGIGKNDINESKSELLESLSIIKAASGKMKNIIGGINSYSDKFDTSISEFGIREIIDEALNKSGKKISEFGIDVTKTVENFYIKGNKKEWENLVCNIVENGVDSLKRVKDRDKRLKLRTEIKEGIKKVEIEDNGTGIGENIKTKIFDPFFTTKGVGEGIGLGLTVAYDIAVKNNVELSFESEEGRGTIFKMMWS